MSPNALGAGTPRTFLLSYPRSGNSWVRYIAEWLSGRPSLGCQDNPEDIPLCQNTLRDNPLAHVRQDLPPVLLKSHGEHLDPRTGDRLILLTRDPCIAIRRHTGGISLGAMRDYTRLLDVYRNWQGEKLHISYETLVAEPVLTVSRLASYLGLDAERVTAFLREYAHHRDISLRLYSDDRTGIPAKGRSVTGGASARSSVRAMDRIKWQAYRLASGAWRRG